MRYQILGRLNVWNGQEWSQLNAAKWRLLLTCLLINANRFVSADRLIAELWGDQPPESAAKTLQVYVYRLRRALGSPPVRLLTRPGGYELSVAPDEVDAGRFAALVDQGREALAGREAATAVARLTEALSLWRGRPLADVPHTPTVLAEAERLEERRLCAWEDLADAKLAVGRHAELVAELRELVAEHPLREPLWARLLVALHRCGRRSDALAAYATVAGVLSDELGVRPGSELRRIHQQLLADEPEPPAPPPDLPAPRAASYQLPGRVPDFVGRHEQVDRVLGLLDARRGPAGAAAARTVLVTGKAGVGKSAFAVHVADLMRDAFPDGQLFADLRGPENSTAEPADVLASLLKTLGVTGAEIPDGVAERARRYRAVLAGLRVLVVLDNAVHERQVRPLLPGTGHSAALVTSRAALAGLEAVARVGLDVLSDAEALDLLSAAAGDDRSQREPHAARRLIGLCGNLPLALRIAGARLATRRHLSAGRLADALDDERRRLDELVAGDLEVRSSVALSYETLQAPARRALRLLGLLSTPTVPGWVVGALLDRTPAEGERVTGELVDNHLLEFDSTDATLEHRYRLHDLVRLFARERAEAEDTPAARTAALGRVCAAYLTVARRADESLDAGFLDPAPAVPAGWRLPDADLHRLTAAPLSWLNAERTTLCALIRQAAAAGLAGVAWRLAAALAGYFEIATHFDDWRDVHEVALAAARQAGDRLGEAVMCRNLGELNTVVDRYDEAIAAFQTALRAYQDTNDPGETAAASGLGVLLRLRGRYLEAAGWLDRAIDSARSSGSPRAEAYARRGLVSVHLERGDIRRAERDAEQALTISNRIGHHNGMAAGRRCLGLVYLAAGRLSDAAAQLELSGELAAKVGDHAGEVHARHWLAHLADVCGEPDRAERMLDDCLAAYRRYGERFGEALTLRSQADLYLHSGRTAPAVAAVERSLSIWQRLDSPYWTARTLDVRAAVAAAGGQPDAARSARSAARKLRAGLGLPATLRAVTVGGRELGAHLARQGI
ncbi:BTAD domain-containing putative transcriptional regulator [Phytohabitans sp. ZYX-F-186]|uniref:BTAD domain-containing putative transcriptional regulator n=1 Tax=Phytohabitans maris TaxID=3071409 RepID=A0ABU0ZPU9_9ACTN|nr:BTAD domain-containing putative transcriptional regulator [Phytohabitans sp. ZYX-F-186]MDQ7908255.1 BTAD domain-containing putative transcriptional regulator [Phytohabitans sp. ZYX-F-186]